MNPFQLVVGETVLMLLSFGAAALSAMSAGGPPGGLHMWQWMVAAPLAIWAAANVALAAAEVASR